MESIVNFASVLLQKMWLSNSVVFHSLADFSYDIACYIFRLRNKESEEEILSQIDGFYPECSEEDKKKWKKRIHRAWMKYGFDANDFLKFESVCSGENALIEFVSGTDAYKYSAILNERKYRKIFDHKYQAFLKYKKYYKRDVIKLSDFKNNVDFFNKHPIFIYKPEHLSRGDGVKIVNVNDYENVDAMAASLQRCNDGVCEELIKQAPEITLFHHGSVNTVRLAVVRGMDGEVRIYGATLKVGQGNTAVDSICKGGLCANIDFESGIIITDAVDTYGNKYVTHPDTDIKFKGFQIPRWQDLKQLCLEISDVIPSVRYVGWDMALSENGWVIVEGNYDGHHICQYPDLIPRKSTFIKLMELN